MICRQKGFIKLQRNPKIGVPRSVKLREPYLADTLQTAQTTKMTNPEQWTKISNPTRKLAPLESTKLKNILQFQRSMSLTSLLIIITRWKRVSMLKQTRVKGQFRVEWALQEQLQEIYCQSRMFTTTKTVALQIQLDLKRKSRSTARFQAMLSGLQKRLKCITRRQRAATATYIQ